MRWEGYEWIECSTGGGEGVKRYEDGGPPHPLPTCKPAGGRRGGEISWQEEPGGVGGVLGAVGKIFGLFTLSSKESVSLFLGAGDWPGSAWS